MSGATVIRGFANEQMVGAHPRDSALAPSANARYHGSHVHVAGQPEPTYTDFAECGALSLVFLVAFVGAPLRELGLQFGVEVLLHDQDLLGPVEELGSRIARRSDALI